MPLSVLVVDDDDRFRGLAVRIMAGCGYQPITQASSLLDAMGQAPLFQPDVAIVDFGLPDGDGLELSEKLIEALPSIKVVLISADSDATTQECAEHAGAVAFLPKSDLSCAVLNSVLKSE